MIFEMGEIIASRSLDLIEADGGAYQVVVHIGRPRQFPDSTDYLAPYQIEGVGKGEVWYAAGVDGVQALQLVMRMIDAELNALKLKPGVELRWVGDDTGDLGFVQHGTIDR